MGPWLSEERHQVFFSAAAARGPEGTRHSTHTLMARLMASRLFRRSGGGGASLHFFAKISPKLIAASFSFFLEEFHGLRIQDTGADPHTATKPPTRTLAPPRHRPRPPRSTQTQQPHTPRVSTPGNSSRCLVGRGTRVGPKVRLQAAPLYVSSTLGAGRRPWVGVGCLPQAAPDSSVRQTPQRYSRLAAGALHKRPDSCKGRRTRHIGRAALSDASARRARARTSARPQ